MRLTAVELTIERDGVSEYKKGETGIFLLGEDNEWHTFAPGTVIEVNDEDLNVLKSSEDSPYGDVE
jgi:hypothetical protein